MDDCSTDAREVRIAMIPTSPLRLALSAVLVSLTLQGCGTRLLEPDPLNKTTSIVNGTQVTRGPSRGVLASGFAETVAPAGNSFEPALGEPFAVDQFANLPGDDLLLPELQGIDFDVERAGVLDYSETGVFQDGSGQIGDGTSSVSYFNSEIGQTVYFATDSSDLTEEARDTLRRQAAWMSVNTQARASIEGHADERGTREYNLALGDRRASATRGYLIAVGVDASRLDKTSYGKERPVATGSDEQAWARNRRTETVIDAGSFAGASLGDTTFGSEPFVSEPFVSDISTATLDYDPLFPATETSTIPSATQPFISGTSDSLILDPLFPDTGTTALISPPGITNYESTSGLYAPAGQVPPYDGGTIAPTVFDADTATPVQYGRMVPVPPATPATRIEDVSVDDLLRDPSLIDRIGTPVTTTPGS